MDKIDDKRYLSIIRALRAGRNVSKEDIKYFASYHENFDTATYEKLKGKLATEEGLKNMTDADWDSYVDEAKKMLASPKYKEDTLAVAKEAAAGKVSKEVATGINVLLAGTDLAIAQQQINKGKQQLSQTARPARPAILSRDQQLQQALFEGQQAKMTEPAAIQAARVGNLDAYQADDTAAKTAAAGQPGAYGAYHQAAAGRYARNNLALVPMADQIRAREEGNYNQLLGMKLNENQAINQSQSQFYPQDLYQYDLDRQAANSLITTGQSNMRSGLTGFARSLPAVAAQASNRKYDDIYNQMSIYGQDHAQNAADAWQELDENNGRPVAKRPDDQYVNEDAWMWDRRKY